MGRRLTIVEDPRYEAFVERYYGDPLRFAVEVCDMVPSEDQADLLIAISAPRAKVSVVSGTSTGKSATFARIALHHFLAYPFAFYEGKMEVGSNTYIGGPFITTVADGIWKEMQDARMAISNGPYAWLLQYFTITKTRVVMRGFEDQWFVSQIALAKGQSVGVAGKHRYHQLVIVDEACGVGDDHFDVIDGTQTQGHNRTLMASQGARSSGRFYDTHHRFSYKNGGDWYSMRFNSENSPFVDAAWLRNRLMETGGRDSVEYQIRVLGLFPELTEKFLLGSSAIERMIRTKDNPVPYAIQPGEAWGHVIVIDVAAGVLRDKTVVMHGRMSGDGDRVDTDPRKLDVVKIPVYSNTLDWEDVVGTVVNYVRSEKLSNPTFVVDIGGQGEQFARTMERRGLSNIKRVQWGNPPWRKKNKERFFNQRAQCSVHASEAVRDGRVTFTDEHRNDLVSQGSRIPFHFDEKARFHIMPKDKMKEDEGLPSPDLWDTICMAYLDDVRYTTATDTVMGGGAQEQTLSAMEAALAAAMGGMPAAGAGASA